MSESAGLLVAAGISLLVLWLGRRADSVLDAAARRRGFRPVGVLTHRYYWPEADSPGTDLRRQLTLSALLLVLGVVAGVAAWLALYR